MRLVSQWRFAGELAREYVRVRAGFGVCMSARLRYLARFRSLSPLYLSQYVCAREYVFCISTSVSFLRERERL